MIDAFTQTFSATFGLVLGVGFACLILIFFGILLSIFYDWLSDRGARWK